MSRKTAKAAGVEGGASHRQRPETRALLRSAGGRREGQDARTLTVVVEGMDLAAGGSGYVTLDGRRVFVDGVLPGEAVEIERPARPGGTVATLLRVLRPSPHRVVPACRHFGPCGGCALQHVSYAEQLRLKTVFVEGLLRAALGTHAPAIEATLPTTPPWGYRDKVHFVFAAGGSRGDLVMGHYRRGTVSGTRLQPRAAPASSRREMSDRTWDPASAGFSGRVLPVEECPVHAPAGNEAGFAILRALRGGGVQAAGSGAHRGVARHLVVRVAEATGERLVTLVVTANDRSLRPALREVLAGPAPPEGLHLNLHDRPGEYLFGPETRRLAGVDRVRESVAGVSFLLSPTSFFQTNVRAAAQLAGLVLTHAGRPRLVLDLYAGVGLFALPLARQGGRVVAVEDNRQAVEDGEASRRLNGMPETACRFVRARAEDVARGRVRRGLAAEPDLVTLDPPRSGCPAVVLNWLARDARPARVIYVSCNPEALARDLRMLADGGYRATLVQPIDMFPHTAHVETVAVLSTQG